MPLPNILPTRPTTAPLTFEILDSRLPSSPSAPPAPAAPPPPDLDRLPTLPAPSSSSKPLQRNVHDEYQLARKPPWSILTQHRRPERLKHKWPPRSASAATPSDMPWNSICPPSHPAAQSPNRFSARGKRGRERHGGPEDGGPRVTRNLRN